jgi:hypothetical protein
MDSDSRRNAELGGNHGPVQILADLRFDGFEPCTGRGLSPQEGLSLKGG